jgi:undecaprenyl-diphosphatase
MNVIQAIVLGIVQGITEFFPISSSGHLAILQHIFGMRKDMVAFDVFLHFGTLVAILIMLRKDIINMFFGDKQMLKYILIACVPTFIIGILFKDSIETLFANVRLVGYALMGTGVFLLFASLVAFRRKKANNNRPPDMISSILIGIAQGVAVVPGISRSGSTIGTALISGLEADAALRFSFLLAVPAILGANLLKAGHIYGNLVSVETVPYVAGFIAAMAAGLVAIKALFGILRKNLFFIFSIYCIAAGLAVILLIK